MAMSQRARNLFKLPAPPAILPALEKAMAESLIKNARLCFEIADFHGARKHLAAANAAITKVPHHVYLAVRDQIADLDKEITDCLTRQLARRR